jgi:hypothetical protein
VEHGDIFMEPCAEPGHGLGREGDLRHEDDRGLPPAADDLPQQLDVHQGFPRTGHPVKEKRGGRGIVQGPEKGAERPCLRGGWHELGGLSGDGPTERVAENLLLLEEGDPLVHESPDHGAGEPPGVEEYLELARTPGGLEGLVALSLPDRPPKALFARAQVRNPLGDPNDFPRFHRRLRRRKGLVIEESRGREAAHLGPDRAPSHTPAETRDPDFPFPLADGLEDPKGPRREADRR